VWPDPDGTWEEVVGFVTVGVRGDDQWGNLDKAAIYVSDTPTFFAGTLCGRIDNPQSGEKITIQCETPTMGRYVTIFSGYTNHLTICEVQVFSCLMPNSAQLPGTSCTSLGFGPELASRPEFEEQPADAYPFTGDYAEHAETLDKDEPSWDYHGTNRRIGNVDLKIDQFESEYNAGSESIVERVAVTERNLAFGRFATDGDGYDVVNMAMQSSTPAGAFLLDGNVSTCEDRLVAGTAGGLPWDPHYRIELTTETMIHTVWVKTNEVEYDGEAAVTERGYECQPWDEQLPNAHPFGDRSIFLILLVTTTAAIRTIARQDRGATRWTALSGIAAVSEGRSRSSWLTRASTGTTLTNVLRTPPATWARMLLRSTRSQA